MSAFEIVLAGAIIVAAVLQVLVLFFLYRVVARLADRTERLIGLLEPEIEDLAAGVRAVRRAAEVSSDELRSTLAGVRAVTEELGETVRTQGHEIARVVGKASAAAERQIAEADRALDRAREKVSEIGDGFDRAVLEPARTILAVATGVRKALEAIATRRPAAHIAVSEESSSEE
jgi:signal transduction histidine kinase